MQAKPIDEDAMREAIRYQLAFLKHQQAINEAGLTPIEQKTEEIALLQQLVEKYGMYAAFEEDAWGWQEQILNLQTQITAELQQQASIKPERQEWDELADLKEKWAAQQEAEAAYILAQQKLAEEKEAARQEEIRYQLLLLKHNQTMNEAGLTRIELIDEQITLLERLVEENEMFSQMEQDIWKWEESILDLENERLGIMKQETQEAINVTQELQSQKLTALSMMESIQEAKLRAAGLSGWALEGQMKQFKAAALSAKTKLLGEDGYSLSEYADIAGEFVGQAQGFGIPEGLQSMYDFFNNMASAQTITNDNSVNISGDGIGTLETNQQVNEDWLLNQLEKITVNTGTGLN